MLETKLAWVTVEKNVEQVEVITLGGTPGWRRGPPWGAAATDTGFA